MTGSERVTVSLILTVKNEEATLTEFFASVDAQSLKPDEVILVDGGSTDGTLDVARSWKTDRPFVIVSEPGSNIAAGRNIALNRASSDIVAVTDAGTRLDPDWLRKITEPFRRPAGLQPDVVAGFFQADPRNRFELALGVTTLPDLDEIDPEHFLPSSRSVAFRRSLFEVGLRYPEWLDYCEDLVFDLKLRRAGARFEFSPGATVAFRPRSSVQRHWEQYVHYARGDGQAGLFPLRHAVRYATYFGLLPVLLSRRDRTAALALVTGSALYLRKPLRRFARRRKDVSGSDAVVVLALIPALRAIGDAAKMVGYPAGLWLRLRANDRLENRKTAPDDQSVPSGDLLQK